MDLHQLRIAALQVTRRGADASKTITLETTHLIVVDTPGTEPEDAILSSTGACRAPAEVLQAVQQHAGGLAGLKILRALLEQGKLTIKDRRCAHMLSCISSVARLVALQMLCMCEPARCLFSTAALAVHATPECMSATACRLQQAFQAGR